MLRAETDVVRTDDGKFRAIVAFGGEGEPSMVESEPLDDWSAAMETAYLQVCGAAGARAMRVYKRRDQPSRRSYVIGG